MKLALIPPIPNLGQFNSTGIHLLLAQHLSDSRYFEYYHTQSLKGDFLILDNGAHEGPALPLWKLLNLAGNVGAHEVVIPDVPHNKAETYARFVSVLRWLHSSSGVKHQDTRFMFVPQIEKTASFLDYVSVAMKMMQNVATLPEMKPEQFTIGIALMYDHLHDGGLLEITDRVVPLADELGIQVHLLGWSRRLMSPIDVARRFPTAVRSCDTCKPFVYARAGIRFAPHLYALKSKQGLVAVPTYPGRPEDYFTKELSLSESYDGNFNANILQSLIFDAGLSQLPEPDFDMPETHR